MKLTVTLVHHLPQLSTFGMLWDSLFGWVSSSSLAYIYGKDESAYEEFLFVNGSEYPQRIIAGRQAILRDQGDNFWVSCKSRVSCKSFTLNLY